MVNATNMSYEQLVNMTTVVENVVKNNTTATVVNKVTATINATALAAKEHMIQQLTAQVNALRTYNYIFMILTIGLFLVLAFFLWKYKLRFTRLVKKGYEWIHLISAGRIRSYLLKHSDYYEIDNQVYIGDESADLIEYGTGIRHKFFFEDSPYQLMFIPSGVRITPPKDASEYVKKKFENLAPKVIHIKSPMSSRVLDGMLQKSALFGREITKLGKGPLAWLDKNKGIGLILAAIALMMLLSMLFGKH